MPFPRKQEGAPEAGFSLIEVIITLGILMSLTVAVASMLRAGFEVKDGLSQRARVIHRLSTVTLKISEDIQAAYYVNPLTPYKNPTGRRTKGLFKIEKNGASGDKLTLTTKTHRSIVAGAYESDTTLVVYELRDSKEAPGRHDLYRGEWAVIPEDMKTEPPMRILARHIKSFGIEFWTGDKWSKDYWDTGRGDTRNKLPRLVKINVEGYAVDRVEGDLQDEQADQTSELFSTVVVVQEAWEYSELREQDKSVRWTNL